MRRLSRAYDNLGRRATVVQYDNGSTAIGAATGGVDEAFGKYADTPPPG